MLGRLFGFDMDHLLSVLAGAPMYKPQKKPKAALSEIIKSKPSRSREIEYLVHSKALWPHVERRLYTERDRG